MKFLLAVFVLTFTFNFHAQLGIGNDLPKFFGFQVRTLFPTSFMGGSSLSLEKDGFETFIQQDLGYAFGGNLRVGLTELIAFETGLNLNQRHYSIQSSLADSGLYVDRKVGFIQYDIPINALIYVKLNKSIYMNASLGIAATYKPSSIGIITNPGGKSQFFHLGLVDIRKKIGADLNANVGFEYRTNKIGTFYLGGSARLPFGPMFLLISKYEYLTYEIVTYGNVGGSFISLDFKYFLPNFNGLGRNAPRGPIE
ncbi:MAG: hypothetical protein RL264_1373 [Bacteroidota bacterium]|jgi:hypothetical protein